MNHIFANIFLNLWTTPKKLEIICYIFQEIPHLPVHRMIAKLCQLKVSSGLFIKAQEASKSNHC